MALIDQPQRARQLARAIASDLAVYNEERIVRGLEKDNLFDALKAEIEEGRQLFESRVQPTLIQQNIFERALVDVLIRAHGHIRCKAW